MLLQPCMVGTSYRQYRAWNAWLDQERNRPTKSEHYLMQIACEVCRGNAKNPKSVKLEQFKLKFTDPAKESILVRATRSKNVWMAALGVTPDGYVSRS